MRTWWLDSQRFEPRGPFGGMPLLGLRHLDQNLPARGIAFVFRQRAVGVRALRLGEPVLLEGVDEL